jgi:ankyrin repeat protein
MLAAERGMIQIVQDLIRRNLSGIINHQNLLGESALLIAVKFQHISCIKALFNAGAATNLQNYCNETALSLAIQSANPLIIELFQPQYPEAPEEIFFCYQPEDIQNFDNAAASSASVSQAYTENKEQQESLNEDSFNEDYINFLIDSVLGKQYLDSSDELPSKRRKKNPIAYEVFLETTLGKTGLSEEERASRKRLKGSGY